MGEFMKRWHLWGGALCSALILSSGSLPSFADEPPVTSLKAVKAEKEEVPEEKDRVSLVLFFGPQGYKMGDVNHGIEENNRVLSAGGFQAKKLSGGTGFGAGIRVAHTPRLSLQLDYDHLIATAKSSGVINTTTAVEGVAEIPANAFLLTAGVHRKWHGIHYGVGGGPGYYLSHGKLTSQVGTQHLSYDVKGSGFGFHLLGLADAGLSRHLRFEAALGYRFAKTGTLKNGENEVVLGDGSTLKADWSGMTSRIGLSVPFDPGHYPDTQNLK
jgi:hypothetical protein